MNIFISGGAKNGKSMLAQVLAREMAIQKNCELYYVATMNPVDGEDDLRIKRHQEARLGWGFKTIEKATQVLDIFSDKSQKINQNGVFLFDSVTALLSNEMFRKDGSVDMDAPARVACDVEFFARKAGNVIFVSDYIYSDARKFDALTEEYRKGLAKADLALSKICDKVIEVTYGNVIFHKGKPENIDVTSYMSNMKQYQ